MLIEPDFEQSAPGGSEKILFVDDEPLLVELGVSLLEFLGYKVTGIDNSEKALREFTRSPQKFDLLITDQTMPGITGSDLAQQILKIRPGMPIILCTGFSNLISQEKARDLGIKGFAMKPLAKADLAALIRKVLDREGSF
jgi:CheY-like chemotaxis protein